MELHFAAKTDVGLKRKVNEDCVYVNEATGLCAVADGMGGHSAGDVASRMVIDIIEESFSDFEPTDDESIREAINETIQLANYAVKTSASQNPEQRGMGSTITLLFFHDTKYYIAQVGDSRAYLIRDNQIFQITEDHSLVQQELEKGLITEEEAESHVFKNIITRAVGIKDEVEVDFYSDSTQNGDLLLLCSDGLTNKVSNIDILKEITSGNTLDNIASSLIELANLRDGSDNISLTIVQVGSKVRERAVSEKSGGGSKKLLFTGIFTIVLAVCAVAFYMFYWKKDPTIRTTQVSPTPQQNVDVVPTRKAMDGTVGDTSSGSTEIKPTPVSSFVEKTKPTPTTKVAPVVIKPTATRRPKRKPPTPTPEPVEVEDFSDTVQDFGKSMGALYQSGLSSFHDQDIEGATRLWNEMLHETKAKYSLQIEVDSKEESARSTFEIIGEYNLFILKKGTRYYVYAGLFTNHSDAAKAVQMLPETFRKRGPIPKPVSRIRIRR